MQTTSTFIPTFDVKSNLDLAGIPKLVLTNLSTGSQMGCKFAFELYTPLGVPLHIGSFSPADAINAWTTYTFLEDFPVDMGTFEFGQYRLVCKVQDPGNLEFSFERKFTVVRPSGNKVGAHNNYGKGGLYYEVKCHTGKIFASDRGNYSYNGKNGTVVERKLTLAVPPDNTNTIPDPITISNVPNVNFSIPFSGENFTLFSDTVIQYDLGNNCFVTIRYKDKKCFPVLCNIDLCKIVCEVNAFEDKVACNPNDDDARKLLLMTSKLNQALIGKMQPGCGINVQKLVNEIIDLGNFDCKCVNGHTTGIGSGDDCGCDACKILATLGDKVNTSGTYYITVNKEADHACKVIGLKPICPEPVDIIGEFGEGIIPTTVPVTTVPPTTVPATTTIPGTTTTPTTEQRFRAFWGWKDTSNLLDSSQIEASANFDDFPVGSFVNADYRSNSVLKFLWVAIPVSETMPTSYYGNPLWQGALGSSTTFAGPVTTTDGTYFFIISNFKTYQTQDRVQFRH